MAVIDVHTHMLTRDYLDLLETGGAPDYSLSRNPAGQESILCKGAPFFTLNESMCDYDMRIRDMDQAGVDVAIVSLTCPNAYFGGARTSLKAARIVNDSMSEQQTARPDRIRWLASLPWQFPELALEELERSIAAGAVGVMVIANIAGRQLTDSAFVPIWQEIDRRALPVLVHPGPPVGATDLGLADYGLAPAAGFPFDTSIAFARLFLDGFLDRHPNLKLIASHGGGALPYLAARLDRCHEKLPAASIVTQTKPSEYLQRIYFDTVVYSQSALELCLEASGSAGRLLYGSDYPHNIGDMPGCLERVDSLAPEVAKRVRGQNSRQLFNL